ncbi:zinc finger protein 839 isoform X3 [Sceloporus undulatus]|uniref:zinc finger protein 839 isoform X3 n=1 Tax=Sceloporus undulatus TaxID=8520 RepID=UPI001C4D85A8|nr:zinc finger protein 839 isoform X3 [Sceloporus undulatus]
MAAPVRNVVVEEVPGFEEGEAARCGATERTLAEEAAKAAEETPVAAAASLQASGEASSSAQGRSGEAAVALSRLLPPKQLEALCVQVQPEKTKKEDKSALSPAVVHPENVTIPQPVEENSSILGLSVNPQIIHMRPVMGTESQPFFLHNSSEPTVQLLLHSSLHPLGQISVGKIATLGQKNKPAAIAPADSPNNALISENSFISHEKKSLKVKTRSGRISRPPKYKAMDYKFIKTEALADYYQSDSDDYFELNLEDDEGGMEEETCSLFEFDLRPKLFKCQSCEKSYIGQGGLARHYKLNPDHGQQESQSSLINRPHRNTSPEYTGKSSSENTQHSFSPPPITVGLVNENGIDIELEKGLLKESEGQPDTSTEDRKSAEQLSSHLLHSSCGRARRRRHSQSKQTERTRYSGRSSRSGQFTSKCHNNMSSKHHSIFRRKARLNELTQQCANEDLMELAVLRLTKVTVFEFLLMKVEQKQKYQKKALFLDVYQEFEELHAVVKKMCEDYIANSELNEPVEVRNPKVAESLGITDSFLVLQKTEANCSSECIKTTDDHVFTKTVGQKHAAESSDEILPLAKKSRVQHLLENMNSDYSNHNGIKEGSSTYKGSCAASVQSGSALWEEEHESPEEEIANDQANLDLYDQNTQVRFQSMLPLRKSELEYSGCLSSWGELTATDSAVSSDEKLMQAGSQELM